MKMGEQVAGEWRSSWDSRDIKQFGLTQRARRTVKKGGRREANLYSSKVSKFMKVEGEVQKNGTPTTVFEKTI